MTDSTNKLLNAASEFIEDHGGKAVVAGNIGIMDAPGINPLDPPSKYTFYLTIKITGKRPTPEPAESEASQTPDTDHE